MGLVDKEIEAPPLLRLLDYWETKRGKRRFPARRDLDPLDFSYLLGNVALIDVLRTPLRFRIRLFGDNLVRKAGIEVTGRMLDEVPLPQLREHFARRCAEIVERGTPYRTKGDYFMDERPSRHEMLALPLSDDGAAVSMLLFAFWFAEDPRIRQPL
ncbi:MAG: PAS domain-containing protein [Stellaceae bacterium]